MNTELAREGGTEQHYTRKRGRGVCPCPPVPHHVVPAARLQVGCWVQRARRKPAGKHAATQTNGCGCSSGSGSGNGSERGSGGESGRDEDEEEEEEDDEASLGATGLGVIIAEDPAAEQPFHVRGPLGHCGQFRGSDLALVAGAPSCCCRRSQQALEAAPVQLGDWVRVAKPPVLECWLLGIVTGVRADEVQVFSLPNEASYAVEVAKAQWWAPRSQVVACPPPPGAPRRVLPHQPGLRVGDRVQPLAGMHDIGAAPPLGVTGVVVAVEGGNVQPAPSFLVEGPPGHGEPTWFYSQQLVRVPVEAPSRG